MKHLNCIVVFNSDKSEILFCKRIKDPYKGLYNFVGGKVEPGEDSLAAAYRELEEETGIRSSDITIFRLMDLTYYHQGLVLEIYVGQLKKNVMLIEEINPLVWLPLTEDFADPEKYAGDQNIAHIINIALMYPLDGAESESRFIDPNVRALGIDGCKGGWITAKICDGNLKLYKFESIAQIIDKIPFDRCIIDMVIGLQGKSSDIRPEMVARKELKNRASTLFPAPCRKAVYENTKEERIKVNVAVLGKKFTSQTDAIIPKIREVDEFLQRNAEYKNVILESHPELCFGRLNNEVLLTSKHDIDGIVERVKVLKRYLEKISLEWVMYETKRLKCQADDIVDSSIEVELKMKYRD